MEWEAFGHAGIRMRRDQLDSYIALVQSTAEKAKAFDVEVLCGIEAEVFPEEAHMESMDEVLAAHAWDFVLGSLHAQCYSYLRWLEIIRSRMRRRSIAIFVTRSMAYSPVVTIACRIRMSYVPRKWSTSSTRRCMRG